VLLRSVWSLVLWVVPLGQGQPSPAPKQRYYYCASGPLLGSLLLKAGLAARFFTALLALGALVLAFCLLAAAGHFSFCAGGRCPGIRRR
jgi:hypothetical protein